jgi:hypothetical protein
VNKRSKHRLIPPSAQEIIGQLRRRSLKFNDQGDAPRRSDGLSLSCIKSEEPLYLATKERNLAGCETWILLKGLSSLHSIYYSLLVY